MTRITGLMASGDLPRVGRGAWGVARRDAGNYKLIANMQKMPQRRSIQTQYIDYTVFVECTVIVQ